MNAESRGRTSRYYAIWNTGTWPKAHKPQKDIILITGYSFRFIQPLISETYPKSPNDKIPAVYVSKNASRVSVEDVIFSTDAKNWTVGFGNEKFPFTQSIMENSADSFNFFDFYFDNIYSCLYVLFNSPKEHSRAEQLNALLIAAKNGNSTLMKFKKSSDKYLTAGSIFNAGIPINPSSAAYSPTNQVLCVCGSNGTAVSSDGVSWFVNHDAPKNMTGLFYREDKNAFFAYSLDDKLFYYSNDGGNWTKAGNAPIPLSTITAVDFNPATNVFCAAGLGDKGVYFSKDLNHWTYVNIRNTDTDIASLISLPDKGLYVAMPTSGAYYYTFDYNSWTDISGN